jgi:glycosyltransferase involved in cell wall biosynthesis
MSVELSVVVPAFNEQESIEPLMNAVQQALAGIKYEIIIIDDGSSDGTYDTLCRLQKTHKNLRIIRFRRNYGQTAAMDAGIKHAKGNFIATMDADLQNDPADIPAMLAMLKEQNTDAVCGWRADRHDPIGKKIVSLFANRLRRWLTGETIHDSGCTLKVFRKECFDGFDLQGEMHRFIPALLMWRGFRISEMKVRHNTRRFGKTKYNVRRLMRGFLDLLLVKFWMSYSTKPIHLFGGLGMITLLAGSLIGLYLAFMRLVFHEGISDRPLLLLVVLLILLGVQFMVFGVLADILLKIYFKGMPPYAIADRR